MSNHNKTIKLKKSMKKTNMSKSQKQLKKSTHQSSLIKNVPKYSLSSINTHINTSKNKTTSKYFFNENLFVLYCLKCSTNLMQLKTFRKHMNISDNDYRKTIQFLHNISIEDISNLVHTKSQEYENRSNFISKIMSKNTNYTNKTISNINIQQGSNAFMTDDRLDSILEVIGNIVDSPKTQFIFVHVMYFLCASKLPHDVAVNVYIFLITLFSSDITKHTAFIVWILQLFYLCNEYHDICQAIEAFLDIVVKILDLF